MRTKIVAAGVLMLAIAALGWSGKPPTAFAEEEAAAADGTVAFKVWCDSIVDSVVRTALTVKKPGRKSFVNGAPQNGDEVDGRHNFPPSTTADLVASYYRGKLINAGWVEGTDFTISGGSIEFKGITGLDAGTNHSHLTVDGTSNSTKVPYEPITVASMRLGLQREGTKQAGTITLLAFGIQWNGDDTISTTTSVAVHEFDAVASASQILAAIAVVLTNDGWTASVEDSGLLHISKNARGDDIYSICYRIEYDDDDGTNDDHWIFWGQD